MKKINTSISRCLEKDFKVFERSGNNLFVLAWGKENEYEEDFDEKTGEPSGEKIKTEWCSYESCVFDGVLTPYLFDERVSSVITRMPSVAEYKALYDAMGVSEESQVQLLRDKLKETISRYDKSDAVNDFTIGGIHLWLDSTMRSKVKENLETCQTFGEENTTLRFEGMAFPITVQMGWQMYYSVLAYARDSWNATESHLATVDKLQTIEEILAYDYKAGYPSKLAF